MFSLLLKDLISDFYLAAVANTQGDKTQPGEKVENYNGVPEGIK